MVGQSAEPLLPAGRPRSVRFEPVPTWTNTDHNKTAQIASGSAVSDRPHDAVCPDNFFRGFYTVYQLKNSRRRRFVADFWAKPHFDPGYRLVHRERCKASLCVCQPRFLFYYSLVTHCNQLKRLPETDGPRLKLISIVDFGSLLKPVSYTHLTLPTILRV